VIDLKIKWTEDTTAKVISNSAVAVIAIAFYFIIKNLPQILSGGRMLFKILAPFVIGFVIAYLLSRPVNTLEGFFNRFLFFNCRFG